MEITIILLTAGAYGFAVWLWQREGTLTYLIALLAGNLASLASPLWQVLYQFAYDPRYTRLYTLFGLPLPLIVFIAAWTQMIPPLVVFTLYRRRWWFPGYGSSLLTFALFALYFLLVETLGQRAGWWRYAGVISLPLGASITLFAAVMWALIGLGTLSLLILTRRYALLSLCLVLLPAPLVLSLFVNGLLGAPLYTALLLRNNPLLSGGGLAAVIGTLGTLGLVLWGAHTVAMVIARQRAGQSLEL
jgi:hypothetical protein